MDIKPLVRALLVFLLAIGDAHGGRLCDILMGSAIGYTASKMTTDPCPDFPAKAINCVFGPEAEKPDFCLPFCGAKQAGYIKNGKVDGKALKADKCKLNDKYPGFYKCAQTALADNTDSKACQKKVKDGKIKCTLLPPGDE